jgi:tetraacyldisaccharide 4'-kinase
MRKTKGVVFANPGSTDIEIGDEPMQIYRKFPEVVMAVAEERMVGIPQILHQFPDTQVIVLDDAFQHRKVKAGLNILLTDYSNLFSRDYLFPCGDLRDIRISGERAQMVVVTKCPASLSVQDQKRIEAEIRQHDKQQVYFASLTYEKPLHLFSGAEFDLREDAHVLLVTGIASPEPLKRYLTEKVSTYDMLRYRDHHLFSIEDVQEIISSFEAIKHAKKIILTTEKDAVRLYKFKKEIEGLPFYILPIRHEFLDNRYVDFKQNLIEFVKQFQFPVIDQSSHLKN